MSLRLDCSISVCTHWFSSAWVYRRMLLRSSSRDGWVVCVLAWLFWVMVIELCLSNKLRMIMVNGLVAFADYDNLGGVFAAEVWVFSERYFVVEVFFGGICFLGFCWIEWAGRRRFSCWGF